MCIRDRREADRLVAEAQAAAEVIHERAAARLRDAETGARIIRERTAADVEQLHRDAHEDRRSARAELVSTLAEARAEADRLRAEGRGAVESARAEVSALSRRRDDITAQLAHLSGVIEALAVAGPSSDRGATAVSPDHDTHPDCHPVPTSMGQP